MVYDVHERKDVVTGVTKHNGRGKHNKHHPLVSEANRQSKIDHINSFPPITAEQKQIRNMWKLGSTFII